MARIYEDIRDSVHSTVGVRMSVSSYHFIYLNQDVREPRWSYLHRFLHPGSYRHDSQNMVFCGNLDLSHHVFLSARAKDWTGGQGAMTVLLPYNLVDAILEVVSHKNQLGFVDLKKALEESTGPEA